MTLFERSYLSSIVTISISHSFRDITCSLVYVIACGIEQPFYWFTAEILANICYIFCGM